MISTAKDGRKFMGTQRARRYDQAFNGLPKVPTNDPPNKGEVPDKDLTENEKMGMADGESIPGGPTHESDYRVHGQAHKVTITHDSTGHRVEAEHRDGYTHKSTHLNAWQAWDAGKHLAGVTDDLAPQETPEARARAHPIGPKEDERIKRENKGMGIRVEAKDDQIPGLGA